MAIDTGIYSLLKPLDIKSEGAEAVQGMLSAYGDARKQKADDVKMQYAQKQMDREELENKRKDEEYRISQLGSSIEKLSGMTPDQRAKALPLEMEAHVKRGVITPEEAAKYEGMNEGMFGQIAQSYFNSPTYRAKQKADMEKQLHQAHIRHYGAEDAKLYAEAHKSGKDNTGKIVRGPEAVSLGQASSAVKELEDYGKTLDSVSDIRGRTLGAALAGVQGKLQIGEDGKRAAAVDTAADKVTQVMGTYLQHGVLDQHTFDRYKAMIPTRNDDPEVAAGKLKTLKNLIAQRQNEELAALKQTGYDVSNVPMLQGPGYLEAPKKSSGLIPEANAAQGSSTPKTPDGTIVMKFPDGKLKVVPKGEKGKWIAAGGDVVE